MCNNRKRRQRRPRASAGPPTESDFTPPPRVSEPACPERLQQECRLLWPAADCSTSCRDDHTGYMKPPKDRPNPQPVTTPAEHTAPRPLPSRGHRWGWWPGIVMYTVLLLSLVSSGFAQVPNEMSPSRGVNSLQESGVCTSIDVRNDPQNLKVLTGCRVIEGFLQIVLMDNSDETAYENLTFPELREITGYLLVFRAYGLQSLGKLFPNLAVIRGQTLFSNYALVVYECRSMKELGLYSLTDILRGGVRLEKNTNMCYVNTIDWNLIAPDVLEHTKHHFRENKPENECPVCPGDGGVAGEGGLRCPEFPSLSPSTKENSRHMCWNKDYCQKVCKGCGKLTCNSEGKCCDENCLGGCMGSSTNCTVCRGLSYGDYNDRKCIKECPRNYLQHFERRCITDAQCRAIPKPKGINTNEQMSNFPFRPFNSTCTKECPHGYYEKNDGGKLSCIPCKGPCKKFCVGGKLDSLELIQNMKGCTHVTGSLSIENIKGGGSIVKELEEGVGQIEEISGALKIVRCFPLVSLNFFKKLRVIGGEASDMSSNTSGAYISFTVNDNQNLQELWDWDKHGPIEIRKGELFFHLNPKLCLEKIEPLRTMAKETKFSPSEVVINSNGDKVPCNVTLLNVTVATRTDASVLFTWPAFQLGDERALLGYVMHSIEAPHRNITYFDGRDACRNDGWRLDDIAADINSKNVLHLLTHLKAYTQYAVYVKTETISTERQGAQSNIIYIRTSPGKPSKPKIDKLVALSSDTLLLVWSPPDLPNGNITMYKILVQWEEDNEEYFRQRNYCNEPLVPHEEKRTDIPEELPPQQTPETTPADGKCPCQSPAITKDNDEAIDYISFENQLHNHVYIKNKVLPPETDNENRRRRDLESAKRRWTRNLNGRRLQDPKENVPSMREAVTQMDPSGVYNVYAVEVGPDQRSLNITHLRHFASHMVSIWVCREIENDNLNNDTIPNCSIDIVKSERTLKLDGVDEISKLVVRVLQANQSHGIAKLEWIEPEKPNGPILTYTISYKRLDIENHSPVQECITRVQFTNSSNSYTLKGLNPGNYSVKVMVTSLAGNGNYSAEKYFYIESGGTNQNSVYWAVAGGVVLALVVVVVAYLIHRKYFAPPPFAPTKIIASVNPEYVSSEYVPDEWEVPREKVQLIKELGQGAFGMVYEGIASDICKDGKDAPSEIRCAVKTINEHATDRERVEFLKEASVMKAFDTAHVVSLLGVVSRGQPTFVVMELMANGDLKSYLRSHRPDAEKPRNAQPPPLSRLLQMAMEIADGMAYLSAKKFVHRDLAARNCMVAEDLTVKVGDFGMTRDIYETDYYRKGSKGLLPVRWMSPESLKDGVFTSSSDVWSYGVVLWEMATLASQPYQGLSNDQVLRYVIEGGVMERPENCPDRLYQLMQLTWHHQASKRPTFLQLVSLLVNDANPKFREMSFFFSTQGQEMLHQSQIQQPGVSEEPAPSTCGDVVASWSRGLDSLDSDSSPPRSPRSPRPSPASASYKDFMRLVPYRERARAAPHETEALVNLSQSAPPPKVSPPQSSSQSNPPNGYLPRSGNNGNPSSLNTSRC